jgi:hypothetical protein
MEPDHYRGHRVSIATVGTLNAWFYLSPRAHTGDGEWDDLDQIGMMVTSTVNEQLMMDAVGG